MKKIFALLLLMAACAGAYAQKSYVYMYYDDGVYRLSGDIPDGLTNRYSMGEYSCGALLNLLSEKGFEVEFMTLPSTSKIYNTFLLSKKSPGSSSAVRSVKGDDDSDVYEVARYNLQGIPISEKEKGVQIVVYSNYTTKTIIRE